jgi:hypothetical protein
MALSGVKQTWVGALQMSAFDPKRTSGVRGKTTLLIAVFVLSYLTKSRHLLCPGEILSKMYKWAKFHCSANLPWLSYIAGGQNGTEGRDPQGESETDFAARRDTRRSTVN